MAALAADLGVGRTTAGLARDSLLLTFALAATTAVPLVPPCLHTGNDAAISVVAVTSVPDYPDRVPALGPRHDAGVAGARAKAIIGGRVVIEKRADRTGHVCLTVPPGEYTLAVSADGYEPSVVPRIALAPHVLVERQVRLRQRTSTAPAAPSPSPRGKRVRNAAQQ